MSKLSPIFHIPHFNNLLEVPSRLSILDLDLQQQYYQMTGRYERNDPLTLYHHQKSHYEHIFNPRSTMRLQAQNKRSLSLQRKNKSSNEKERIRKMENKKMLNNLLDIYNNKPGLLSRVEEESREKTAHKKRVFFSSYKKDQEEKEIQRNNRDLFYSILHVGPSVGNHKQWDRHFEQHLRMEKKLCNHPLNDFQALDQFRQSYTKEKMRRKHAEETQRQQSESHLQEKTHEISRNKLNQRKKKWQMKKVSLIEKGVPSTQMQGLVITQMQGLVITQMQDQQPKKSSQL